jgi:hypothetical protein
LQNLDLSNTAVTDNGIRHLHGLQNLKKIGIMKTAVTDEGMEELKSAVPSLTMPTTSPPNGT